MDVAEININANIILVVVEFFAPGHAEQHNEQAALPKQQAAEAAQNGAAKRAPIENR